MSSQNLDDLTPSYIRDRALSKDEELDALVKRLENVSLQVGVPSRTVLDSDVIRSAATAITTLRAQLAEALEWKRYWSGEMDVVLAGRADETARADRAEAEISRLTDLNSTAYIDGHDAAKNEYRDEIQRLEVLNAQPHDRTALQSAIRAAKVEAWREAAYIAANACLVHPDGGNPTEEERLVCEEAYRRILALIEREATHD